MNYLPTSIIALFASALISAAAPNVLFIVADDLRPELGSYGADYIQSPNIDRLAQRGMSFERAYCQVAICNPSRNSLLSGLRPDTTGILDNNSFLRPSLPDVITLPQHFKNHGYTSLSIGKIFHHSTLQPGDDPLSWSEPAWYYGPDGAPYDYSRETSMTNNVSWFTQDSLDYIKRLKSLPEDQRPRLVRGPPYEAANLPDDIYPDGQTAAQAIYSLRRLKAAEKPFFLAVGFVKPHLPFNCPQRYWDLYPADTIKLPDNYSPPENVPALALHNWYELRGYGRVPAQGPLPDEMALNLIRGYRASVSFMDAQVGRVIAELDRLGLRDDTVIIFLGDHGYNLGENGVFTKMTNFELGTHAPLIVSLPKQKTAGQSTRALVEFVDIYPTLAELCELPLPDQLEGTSLNPLLKNPNLSWKTAAFSQYWREGRRLDPAIPDNDFMGRSIRTDRWRYTEWTDRSQKLVGVELYDHQNDSGETTNIAASPKHSGTVAELARQLQDGWEKALPAKF